MNKLFHTLLTQFKGFGTKIGIWYLRNPISPYLSKKVLDVNSATIGAKTRIKHTIYIDNAMTDQNSTGDFSNLFIGENCYIGDCVYFDLADNVCIGDNVTISGRVSFITHADCNRSPYVLNEFPRESGKIIVDQGAWIGFGATIMHGVKVNQDSIVASGSLLKDDTEPRSIYAGVPAKKIGEI